jgi:hypothetical protein
MKQTIGTFLFRRLHEAGAGHICGVPGDYNVELTQQLEDRGEPTWIGNCNELNAAYAACDSPKVKTRCSPFRVFRGERIVRSPDPERLQERNAKVHSSARRDHRRRRHFDYWPWQDATAARLHVDFTGGVGIVESVMDKNDSPVELILGGHAFADKDHGPRGPQSAPGTQIEVPSPK